MRQTNRKKNRRPDTQSSTTTATEAPEYWGDESPDAEQTGNDEDEDPAASPTFWGKERAFQVKPVVEIGEATFHPLGGLTVKDLKVADKGTLVILVGAALVIGTMVFFGIPSAIPIP